MSARAFETGPLRISLLGVVLACACLSSASAQRQGARISMSVSAEAVEVGQPFVLEIEIESDDDTIEEVRLPPLDQLQVIARQVSQPTQVTWSSQGRPIVRRSVVHTLRVVATRAGRIDIAPASARIGGAILRSDALTIKVAGDESAPDDPQALGIQGAVPGGDSAEFDETAFVRTVVDNPNPWLGQQVTVTVYLYTRIAGNVMITQAATTDGFWIQDLVDPSRPQAEQVQTVRGRPFRVHVIKRFAAFPLRAGTLTIGPTGLSIGGGISIFGAQQEVSRRGLPLTVEVKPLPPSGSRNALVGRFQAEATIEPATVRTGEAATVTLSLHGTGNLQEAHLALPAIPGLRIDPPEVNDRSETANDLIAGERRFRWLIVPERSGRFTIADFAIPIFDPGTGAFAVLHTNPLALEAIGGATASAVPDPAEAEPSADEPEHTADHALRVRSTSELLRVRARLSDAPLYPLAVAFPPLAFLVYLVSRAARDGFSRRRAAVRGDRRREARRQLTDASKHAKSGDVTAFYAATARAITEIIETRVTTPIGSMTHPDLRAFLLARGMDEDLARRIVDELEGADFARFSASGSSAEELTRTLDRALALIERIERFTPTEPA